MQMDVVLQLQGRGATLPNNNSAALLQPYGITLAIVGSQEDDNFYFFNCSLLHIRRANVDF